MSNIKESSEKKPHDIYTDPAIANAQNNDPFAAFIQERWKQIVVTVAAVLVVIYFFSVFQETHTASMQSAADVFAKIQNQYQTYSDSLEELSKVKASGDNQVRVEELGKKIEENKSALMQLINSASYSKDPYSRLGKLYSALVARAEGNRDSLKKDFPDYLNWKSSSKENSNERFFAELGAMVIAKSLLDDDATLTEGLDILKSLAREGSYAQVSAALVVANLAKSKEEKAEALQILNTIESKAPEQIDLIKDASKRLGS